jgi:serine/threonine-protein kinase TTK/MPS1
MTSFSDYMAPEVFSRETGFKSDVWSAGIILYEMVYGRPPYFAIADRHEKVQAITSMQPIPFPLLMDPYLFDCLRLCLEFSPYHRPDAYELEFHPYTRF